MVIFDFNSKFTLSNVSEREKFALENESFFITVSNIFQSISLKFKCKDFGLISIEKSGIRNIYTPLIGKNFILGFKELQI